MSRYLPAFSVAMLVTSFAASALADLPPPPGKTRVAYSFQIDAPVAGRSIVAYPISAGSNDGHYAVMEPGRALTPFQGWTPGIYSLAEADVAALPKTDEDAAKAYLASHAQLCLKQVPRVWDIATETGVTRMNDVIHVETKGNACESTLAKTVYTNADGKSADGGADAAGKRTAPAPFGKDLPSVSEAGFSKLGGAAAADPATSSAPSASNASPPSSASPAASGAPSSSAPPASRGCAGCTLSEGAARGGSLAMSVAIAAVLAWRRRSRT